MLLHSGLDPLQVANLLYLFDFLSSIVFSFFRFGFPAFGFPAFGFPAFGFPAFGLPAFGFPES